MKDYKLKQKGARACPTTGELWVACKAKNRMRSNKKKHFVSFFLEPARESYAASKENTGRPPLDQAFFSAQEPQAQSPFRVSRGTVNPAFEYRSTETLGPSFIAMHTVPEMHVL
jgi:hypothetical protein